jgi:hypothetical protein
MRAVLFAIAGWPCLWLTAIGQSPTPLANMNDLGLRLPLGAGPLPGNQRRVLLAADDASPVVGLVYLQVGDRYVVTMPNGSLRSVRQIDTIPTDRAFEVTSKKELARELAAQFPEFKIRETRRYIYVYNTSEKFYTATSSILETMHPKLVAYCERYNLAMDEVDAPPLVVVMFRTQAEFQDYRADVGDTILAYYNTVSNRIILYEQSKLATVAPMIAVKQSISTIAHEGVHQILHNIGVQQRLSNWPMWISEGLPEYFAPTHVKRGVTWKGVGFPNDLRMRELFEYVQQQPRGSIGTGALVRNTITADRFTSVNYAVAWALTHFLAKTRREEFLEYVRDVGKTLPLADPEDETERFSRFFGNDLAKLEQQMMRHVNGLPYVDPILNQPHFLVMATTGKRRMAVVTTSPAKVQVARQEMLAKIPLAERIQARFGLQAYPNRSVAERAMHVFTNSK